MYYISKGLKNVKRIKFHEKVMFYISCNQRFEGTIWFQYFSW